MSTRKNIIDKLAGKFADVPKGDLQLVVNYMFEYLATELITRNRLEIRHFGSFMVRKRKLSDKSSLKKDNHIGVREINVVYYRASQVLLQKVNIQG